MQYESLSARLAANSKRARRIVPHLGCACREWTGNLNNSGYPRFSKRVDGAVVKEYAHRAAYELATGKTLGSLTVDHLCVNSKCIEPRHLEAVTLEENTRRRIERTAAAKQEADAAISRAARRPMKLAA